MNINHPAQKMSKTPLLLLPGLLCNEMLWSHQIRHLDDIATCQVADLTQDSCIKDMAQRVLDKAPAKFILAGLSMALSAFEIMRQAPHRVYKLILLATQARPDTDEIKQQRQGLIDLASQGEFKGVTARLLPRLIHESHLKDSLLTDVILKMAASIGREAFVRQQTAIMTRADSRPDMARIACPTFILCGREDKLTPLALHQEIAVSIPHSKLCIIDDCAHLSALEQPQAVTALLRFWITYA
ncbi:MAG: alpha/beta hydrolase [Alphaproteobacteria bacterium]